MELTTLGIAGLALLLFGIAGYMRDTRRNLLTLVATLMGVLIVEYWVPRWSEQLTGVLGGGSKTTITMALSVLTLLATVLIIGYGGSALLPPALEKATAHSRTVAMLLGIFNGALVAGYLVRYLSVSDTIGQEIQGFAPLMFLLDYQGWFLLGPTLLVLVLVIFRGVGRLAEPKAAGAAGAAGQGAARPNGPPAANPPAGRLNTAQVADRVKQGTERRG